MSVTKGQHLFLMVAFLTVIFGVPVTQMGIELYRGQRPGVTNLFWRYPTEENLRAYEQEMEDASWFAEKLRPWMQYAQFRILHDAGEKVLWGRNRWLFYRPGVQYLVEPWPPRPHVSADHDDVVAAVTRFRDQLATRGIQLLVMPVPGKQSIYPDMLTRRAEETQQPVYGHTSRIIHQLRKADVEVVDLFEVLSQARMQQTSPSETYYYLARDTHWSPDGMRLAAGAVARMILDRGWVRRGTVQYGLKWRTVRRPGDLLQMMQVPQIEQSYEPETIRCAQVVQHDRETHYTDEPDSPLLVLGDSFLRIYERDEPGSAGFIAHLARELGMPLASIVNDGGASTLVRQQLHRKPQWLRGKKLVVWEFIERDIRFGTEGWQLAPLPGD